MFVNVGARDVSSNADIATKTDLKGRFANYPRTVELYVTDAFGPNAGKVVFGDDLDIGVKYSVVGPNPYKKRSWYATVEKLPNGKITVK